MLLNTNTLNLFVSLQQHQLYQENLAKIKKQQLSFEDFELIYKTAVDTGFENIFESFPREFLGRQFYFLLGYFTPNTKEEYSVWVKRYHEDNITKDLIKQYLATVLSGKENLNSVDEIILDLEKNIERNIKHYDYVSFEDLKKKEQQEAKEREIRMKELSAKHAAGTTAEIAAYLGISKAAVRKAKADGTLTAMLEEAVKK